MPNCANNQEIVYPGPDPREPFSLGRVKTCASPMPAAATDELLMKESLAALDRHNIFAVTTGPLVNVRAWRAVAADRIIPAHAFCDPGSPDVNEFRRLVNNRELAVFAEVSPLSIHIDTDGHDVENCYFVYRFIKIRDAECHARLWRLV